MNFTVFFFTLCDGSIDCLLEIEGLYQDALATIDETEQCECQQISCQDWTNIQAPQGTPELTPAQEKELAVYEAAARQYMKFQDPAAMETAIQSGGLEGQNGDHLLLLLLIVHKNNQNGLIKFIILKKIGLFDNPNTSGIVKFIVLKKLFGDSDTLLKLFILERITDNNNNNGV